MEFQDVVRRRRMVRSYTDEPVDPAVVDRAVRNAVRAPNAGFTQGWGFVVLDTPHDVARFWAATVEDPADRTGRPDAWLRGMRRAPVVVVPCSSKAAYLGRYREADKQWTDRAEQRWPVPFWHMDAAMASLLVLQTAVDAGLGACFFGVPGRARGRPAGRAGRARRLHAGRRDHDRPPGRHRLRGRRRLAHPPAPQGARRGRAPRALGRGLERAGFSGVR